MKDQDKYKENNAYIMIHGVNHGRLAQETFKITILLEFEKQKAWG